MLTGLVRRPQLQAVRAALACALFAACRREAAVDRERVVGSVDAGSGRGTMELARERCTAESCEVEVWLRSGSQIRDSATLQWRMASGELTRTPVEPTSGIGGPLARASSDSGWTAGQEEDGSSVFTQPVRLAPAINGMLVTQVL